MNNELLRKLQLCQLHIFKEFLKICNDNKLKYYLGAGTLLGAVRHKGFVPWDYDIDVYMLRDDYEKFIKIANDFLPSNMKLNNFKLDKDYNSYQSTIIDYSITLKLNHTKNGIIKNAWIDIWPLDAMPKNKLSFVIRKYKILYRRFRLQAAVFDNLADIKKKRPLLEKILMFLVDNLGIGKKSNTIDMLNKLDKELNKKIKKPKYYVNAMSVYKFKNMMPIEVYGEGKEYLFENLLLNGPNDYNYFLTRLYGDYMTPIKEQEKDRYGIEFIPENKNEEI